jgi:hypothetical protein
MSYHMTKSAPYFFKRWVAFNKNATLEPLYTFDHVQSDSLQSPSVQEYQEHLKQ